MHRRLSPQCSRELAYQQTTAFGHAHGGLHEHPHRLFERGAQVVEKRRDVLEPADRRRGLFSGRAIRREQQVMQTAEQVGEPEFGILRLRLELLEAAQRHPNLVQQRGTIDQEIDRTALLNEIRVTQRRFEKLKPQAKNPEFWLSHLLGGLHHLLLSADRTPGEKAAAAIGRLEDIPEFLDDLKASLEEPVRVFVETAMRMTEGGRLLVKELAAALGAQAPMHSARLGAAAEQASAALF